MSDRCTIQILMHLKITSFTTRTNSLLSYSLTRKDIAGNFSARSFCPPPIRDAIIAIYKQTPEEMTIRIDSFVTAGISGVIGLNTKNKPNQMKAEIRTLVLQGLRKYILPLSMTA